jgi:sarcosine oxidase subunit gamma
MTETTNRRHGLEPAIAQLANTGPADTGIDIRVRADLGQVNLRGDAGDDRFVSAVEKCLGQSLPVEANTCTGGDHFACWLGPDEWLILGDIETTPGLVTDLDSALSGRHKAINDVSGGQLALQISGSAARDVFAKGCTLDFHPRAFSNGMCAQSGLARASVLFALPESDDEFLVVVRRSFADYLLCWLHDAASGSGVRIAGR